MDWATRTVLSWRLSNTQDSAFCREALQEALAGYGRPEIFNTDQGSQFTSREFTEVLEQAGVAISMDGKGRWMDNVFIERLWRSLKYECVYLHDFEEGRQARRHLASWLRYYNQGAASFQPGRGPDADRKPTPVAGRHERGRERCGQFAQGGWIILHSAKRRSCRVGKEVSGNPQEQEGQGSKSTTMNPPYSCCPAVQRMGSTSSLPNKGLRLSP